MFQRLSVVTEQGLVELLPILKPYKCHANYRTETINWNLGEFGLGRFNKLFSGWKLGTVGGY